MMMIAAFLLTFMDVTARADGYYLPPERQQQMPPRQIDPYRESQDARYYDDYQYYTQQPMYQGQQQLPQYGEFACMNNQCGNAPAFLPYPAPGQQSHMWRPRPMPYPYPNHGRCQVMRARGGGMVIVIGRRPLWRGHPAQVRQMMEYFRNQRICFM